VEAVAEGRVFSGRDAQKLRLVDKLGGLDEAIAAAARLCGLQQYRAVYIERRLSLRQRLSEILQMSESSRLAAAGFGRLAQSPVVAALFAAGEPLLATDPNHCYVLTLARSPLR
jgi:protease-4